MAPAGVVGPGTGAEASNAPSGETATQFDDLPASRIGLPSSAPCGRVPETDGAVEPGGDQPAAARVERQCSHRPLVANAGRPHAARVDVPERHRAISAAPGQRLAVRRERHGEFDIGPLRQGGEFAEPVAASQSVTKPFLVPRSQSPPAAARVFPSGE